MLRIDSEKFISPVIIQDDSREKFVTKVQTLLSTAQWVTQCVDSVRKLLDDLPTEMSNNYKYSPSCIKNHFQIKFECTKDHYKVTFTENERPSEALLQILRRSKESVVIYREDLQPKAKKLSESSFPFETTIQKDGSVFVGGSVTHSGKTMTMKDLLAETKDDSD